MSKRSKKENELLEFLSEDERKVYEEFEAKLKAKRDVAVKRQKKEINFWKEVDEREDEVYQHILEKRKARNAQQTAQTVQSQNVNQEQHVHVENVNVQERENGVNPFLDRSSKNIFVSPAGSGESPEGGRQPPLAKGSL